MRAWVKKHKGRINQVLKHIFSKYKQHKLAGHKRVKKYEAGEGKWKRQLTNKTAGNSRKHDKNLLTWTAARSLDELKAEEVSLIEQFVNSRYIVNNPVFIYIFYLFISQISWNFYLICFKLGYKHTTASSPTRPILTQGYWHYFLKRGKPPASNQTSKPGLEVLIQIEPTR